MLGLLAVIAVADLLIWLWRAPLGVEALWDEPAHGATGLLAVGALGVTLEPSVVFAVLAGSLLIDLDHVPYLLGYNVLERGTARPYTHSLAMLGAVAALALLLRGDLRKLVLIAVVALAMHLLRDIAEPGGPGASLLWPVSDHAWTLGYGWYACCIAALAIIALVRSEP